MKTLGQTGIVKLENEDFGNIFVNMFVLEDQRKDYIILELMQ